MQRLPNPALQVKLCECYKLIQIEERWCLDCMLKKAIRYKIPWWLMLWFMISVTLFGSGVVLVFIFAVKMGNPW